MECLEFVNKRLADFLIADPEDMYVAAKLNNEDFLLFAQIRSVEEPEGQRLCSHLNVFYFIYAPTNIYVFYFS